MLIPCRCCCCCCCAASTCCAGPLDAYVSVPSKPYSAAVVLITDIFGHQTDGIRRWADKLADAVSEPGTAHSSTAYTARVRPAQQHSSTAHTPREFGEAHSSTAHTARARPHHRHNCCECLAHPTYLCCAVLWSCMQPGLPGGDPRLLQGQPPQAGRLNGDICRVVRPQPHSTCTGRRKSCRPG